MTIPLIVISILSLAVAAISLAIGELTGTTRAILAACSAVTAGIAGWMIWSRRLSESSSGQSTDSERDEFDELRQRALQNLSDREQRLDDRERQLTERLAHFQEFFEYPLEDPNASKSTIELQQLTAQDREVQEILTGEAERVYEKLRANGYTIDGAVDLTMIREEVEALVIRVARVYSPESQQPLLETSFEQIARAASRIWLHALVLLEQLPLNVQKKNISELYSYLQKATAAWGTYKAAAPWLRQATRGLYAGRMLATTNPVALGAWWLATEVGRRGASHLMESWVDRQAVAALNDLVAVIGVEVASIYGSGFRQRDVAWVHGCEIVELLHSFPQSRDGLQAGLNVITQLPLKNEYDRIYLYRCLATHRSTGHRIADSSILSREDRESIASSVEEFFRQYTHGVTETEMLKWRSGLEERLDLKLRIEHSDRPTKSEDEQIAESARALQSFATSVLGLESPDAESIVAETQTGQLHLKMQKDESSVAESIPPNEGFQPPDLDPSSARVQEFLNDIASMATRVSPNEDHIIEVVLQTGAWFRRSAAEMSEILDEQWLNTLRASTINDIALSALPGAVARQILIDRQPTEKLRFLYSSLGCSSNGDIEPLEDAWLAGLIDTDAGTKRCIVVGSSGVLWRHSGPMSVHRIKSLLLDSAAINGGLWTALAPEQSGQIVISGSLRGGRYSSYFGPLLES